MTVDGTPTASVDELGAPMTKSAAFVPVITNGVVNGNAVALWLVMVTTTLEVPPAGTVPKSNAGGDTVIAPVGKLARLWGSLGEMSWKSFALLFVSCEFPFTLPGLRS